MLNIILFIYNARIAYGKYIEPKYQYHVDCKIVKGASGARFGEFSTWIWGGDTGHQAVRAVLHPWRCKNTVSSQVFIEEDLGLRSRSC
jgi:hypothetical protein